MSRVLCDMIGEMVKCKVIENLGYSHGAGCYGKVVEYQGREVIVTKTAGKIWKVSSPIASIRPAGKICGQ